MEKEIRYNISFIRKGIAYKVLKLLKNSEYNSREIEKITDATQCSLSENLRRLVKIKILKSRKKKALSGKTVSHYSLTEKGEKIRKKLEYINQSTNLK